MRFPRDEPNTPGPSRGIDQPVDQPPRWVGGPVVHLDSVSAAIATGKRPAPFRTRKLSPSAPMVLPGRPGGRVGRRRTSIPGWRSSTPGPATADAGHGRPPPSTLPPTTHTPRGCGGRDRWRTVADTIEPRGMRPQDPGTGPLARPSLDPRELSVESGTSRDPSRDGDSGFSPRRDRAQTPRSAERGA